MKIFSLIMMVLVMSCSTAQARPGPGAIHHAPSPLHMSHHGWHRPVLPPHHRPREPIGTFLAGLVGTVIGNYVVSDVYQPNTFADTRCFTMVSQLNGHMVRKCVSVQDWAYRPKTEIYNILYVD